MSLKTQTQGFSLEDKSALIVGCGGLGCNIAVHLAGSGIGEIHLCDFDTVSESNLNRQFLYRPDDIGKSKADCVKKRLSLFAPDVCIFTHNRKIQKSQDLDFAKNCNIIFSALDNDETRLILKEFADLNDVPVVMGGIDGFYGMAYLYLPKTSQSLPLLQGTSKAEFSVSSTAGIIGSAQAALGIRYLLTKDKETAKKILIYDETEFSTLELK